MTAQEVVNEINRRRIPTISQFIALLPKIISDVREITIVPAREGADKGLTYCVFYAEDAAVAVRGFNVNTFNDWNPEEHGYVVADIGTRLDDPSFEKKESKVEVI